MSTSGYELITDLHILEALLAPDTLLDEPYVEHLPGKHDQKTHGNKYGKADDGSKVLVYKGGGAKGAYKQTLNAKKKAEEEKQALDKGVNDLTGKYQDRIAGLQKIAAKKISKNFTAQDKDIAQNQLNDMRVMAHHLNAYYHGSMFGGGKQGLQSFHNSLQQQHAYMQQQRSLDPRQVAQSRLDQLQSVMSDIKGLIG